METENLLRSLFHNCFGEAFAFHHGVSHHHVGIICPAYKYLVALRRLFFSEAERGDLWTRKDGVWNETKIERYFLAACGIAPGHPAASFRLRV